MSRYEESDFMITFDGDLILEDDNIKLASNDGNVMQEIYSKLKSRDEEWITNNICGNLEKLLGKPNTRENGELGEQMIIDALTKDGLASIDDIYVKAVPINKSTVIFFVYFKSEITDNTYGFEVSLNLSSGASIKRVK